MLSYLKPEETEIINNILKQVEGLSVTWAKYYLEQSIKQLNKTKICFEDVKVKDDPAEAKPSKDN